MKKGMKLVGGGSVINEATPSSFLYPNKTLLRTVTATPGLLITRPGRPLVSTSHHPTPSITLEQTFIKPKIQHQ